MIRDPADWLIDAARQWPESPFLRDSAGSLRYDALLEESGRFAAALRSIGVEPGDRVAAQIDKTPEAVLLYIACLRMGAVYVPINVANTPTEVAYFLQDAAPRLAIVRPEDRLILEETAARAGVRHVETLGLGTGSWLDRVHSCEAAHTAPDPGGKNAPAAIVYTSGTTGRSKGAVLTRGNLAANAAVLADAWRFTAQDVLLHALPLFHVHGLFVAINTVLASAASLIFLPKFDAAAVLARLPDVTVYMGVPTHYTRLLQEPQLDRRATRNVRLFVSGSAPLLADTHEEFLRRTGHAILERYGMTETLMNTSNPYEGARKPGSVGPPLAGVAVRCRSADGSAEAGTGEIGALEIKGANVFAGYWREAEKTRAAFTADGWFKTGDLGRFDDDGYVYIVGRATDLVITGGYNVYPKDVEAELDGVPGILESAVFGLPHPDFGEAVTAAVVRGPGLELSAAEILEDIKTRLAGYKVPKRILFVDELPRNAMGKVQKSVLRARHAALYGAS
jgi:malonyl-CoA/methylmalonyl-CoA synthetase